MPGTISCAIPVCRHSSASCILKTVGGDGWFNLLREEYPSHLFKTKRVFICICHFNEQDVEYVPKLKKDAIPNFKKEFDAVFAAPVKKEVSLTSITNGPASSTTDDGWDEMKKLFKSLFSPDQIKKLMGHKVDNWTQPMLEKGLRIRSLMSSSAYKKLTNEPTIALPSVTAIAHYANKVAGVNIDGLQETEQTGKPSPVKTYSKLNGASQKRKKKLPSIKNPPPKKPRV